MHQGVVLAMHQAERLPMPQVARMPPSLQNLTKPEVQAKASQKCQQLQARTPAYEV
jgi:hypothetical protein